MSKNVGRPIKKNPRTEPIGFRCTLDERAKLGGMAAAQGVTVGEFCRLKALGGRMPNAPVAAINVAKYQELSRLASSLNQLAKAVNSGKLSMSTSDILPLVYEEVARLRGELIGVNNDTEH